MWTAFKSKRFHLSLAFFVCLGLSRPVMAQDERVWHRLYTGDDSVIDVNPTSIEFDLKNILRLLIRTTFDSPEKLGGRTYQSRLETVEYQLNQKLFRTISIHLLDEAGNTVQSYDLESASWKPLKSGGMMDRLLHGVGPHLPFGGWTVASLSLVDGPVSQAEIDVELQRLIGKTILLEANRASVGEAVCRRPNYKSDRVRLEELSKLLGADVVLQANLTLIELIKVSCDSAGWVPPRSLLIRLPDGEMLMLWRGVFLNLKRDHAYRSRNLKSRPPLDKR